MNTVLRGFANRWVSATSFGLIPLFSIPVMTAAAPMQAPSILVYRFAFGCMGILAILLWKRIRLRITLTQFLEICLLAALYDVEAILMIVGFRYMPSGPATTLVFSYPIWTQILMLMFFKERFSRATIFATVLAFAGVACMSGVDGNHHILAMGVVIELLAGLAYAFYLVLLSGMSVRNMNSLKLTFYVFLIGLALFLLFATLFTGGVEPVRDSSTFLNLLLLGLVCTALSNVMLIPAVKQIGATLTAVLGAFEPLTAMIVGVLVFGEPFTAAIGMGFLLIVSAVMLIVASQMRKKRVRPCLNIAVAKRKK